MCANHAITADLKFSEVKATKNTWMWSSIDFTDDEKGKLEKFAARFETEEESGEFRKVLKEVQSSQQPPVQMVFENQSASKVRSWSCVSCYVNNHAEAVKCIACDTAKPVPATKEVDDKEKEEDEEKDKDQSINSSEEKSDVNDEPDWHAALLPVSDTD